MTETVVKKLSLFRETFSAIKATAFEWWPWVLVFGIFFGALQLMSVQLEANNPITQFEQLHPEITGHSEVLKTNPELKKQYDAIIESAIPTILVGLSTYLLGLLVVYIIAFYTFGVTYMRMTLPPGTVKPSIGGFFYWLKKTLWKYLRPILWILLPIIGACFYLRSLVRRALVTPLALLQKGDELQISWDMTKGNWWRIFRGQLIVGFCLAIVVFLVLLIPGMVLAILTHGTKNPTFVTVAGIVQGMTTSLGVMAGATFSCVAYRVLSQEQAAKPPAP